MSGTIDLTKGILKGFEERGYKVGGFDAYITSNVISAAGVSSSASYEMLICSMLNTMFNEGKMDVVTYAHIGKYAENKFWNKASGLLDQMACAVGGLITIDFKNPEAPVVEKIDFDFGAQDHSLMIVNTGKVRGSERRLFFRSKRDEKSSAVLWQRGLRGRFPRKR